MNTQEDRHHAELLMLYQVTIEDIERSKQWTWTVAYSTIAAEGGILALFSAHRAEEDVVWIRLLFIVLALALAGLGVNHIRHAEAGLDGFRSRIKKVREKFGEPFASTFGSPNPKKRWPLDYLVIGSTAVILVLMFL